MRNFRRVSIALALLAGTAPAAFAADIIDYPPEVVPPVYGGWYLRGDIGMSNQQLHGSLDNELMDATDNFEWLDSGSFSSAPTFQVGIGYKYNDWLRFDGTIQYRGKADFTALDRYSDPGDDADPSTWDGSNEYSATKKEWVVMANAYVDLGTWNGITPYVGGGLGAAQVTIGNMRDINTPNNGVAYGGSHSQWNFAWALHTGLGFDITDRLTLDLGYSYLSLGDGQSGDLVAFDGTNNIDNPMIFNDLISHDFKFGLRYKLN